MTTEVRDISFFGDSVAQGVGDESFSGGWVGRVGREFLVANDEVGGLSYPTVYNLAVLGDTAPRIDQRIETEWKARARADRPRLSIISIGGNDSAVWDRDGHELKPVVSPDRFTDSLRSIMIKLTADGRNRVLYVGITSFDEKRATRFRGRPISFSLGRATCYEEIGLNVSAEFGVPVVPLMERSREIGFGTPANGMLASDQLHPSAAGHKWIADLVLPAAQQLWT